MGKKILITAGILVCIAIVGFTVFYFSYIVPANKVLNDVRNAEIKDVDLSRITNGKYVGEFSYSKSHCKVEVTVNNHRIENIKILANGSNEHARKAEAVLGKVIEEQKINVDVISGATTTSKALLKAVEAALSSGKV